MSQFHVDYGDFKREDTVSSMKINLFNDDGKPITPNKSHTWVGKVVRGNKRTEKTYQILISDDDIFVPSKQMKDLPSGDYGLELWEEYDGETVIYPSAGFIGFHIHRNADDSFQSIDPTIDINQMLKSLHQAGLNVVVDKVVNLSYDDSPRVESKIEDGMNRLTFYLPQGEPGPQGPVGPQGPQGPQGDKGDTGSVDNAGLTSAPAFQALQGNVKDLQVESANVGGVNLAKGTSSEDQTFGDASQTTGWENAIIATFDNPQAGQQYTISVNARTNGGSWKLELWDGTIPTKGDKWITDCEILSTSQEQRYTATFTWPEDNDKYLIMELVNNNDGGQVVWNSAMLEEGTVAHTWSPNPTEVLTQADYAKIKAAIVALGGSLS